MAKVLLYSFNTIGKAMSGPGIRYWEFANALCKIHEVILLAPNELDVVSDLFVIIKKASDFRKYFKQVDVIITMMVTPSMAFAAKNNGVKIILDAYDPYPFELLETDKHLEMSLRKKELNHLINTLNFSFRMADFVLCANEKQRDLWMGLWLSLKKITPSSYDQNTSLKDKITIVPFGLPTIAPQMNGIGPKKLFDLKDSDKIILWGGGIWNWFDPLTLIKAMSLIVKKRSDVYLVFMGVKPLDPLTASLTMSVKAYELAKELGLLDKSIFFNPSWVPYEERVNFLLESTVGVSTHFEHLETHYSFRTRILDYIWACLPIINTEGDSFTKLIKEREIGLTVPYEDNQALAEAILHLIDNPDLIAKMKNNLKALHQDFQWDTIIRPLEKMISSPYKKESTVRMLKEITFSAYRARGILFPLKILINRISERLGISKVT